MHKMGYPEKLGATLYGTVDDAILICRKGADTALKAFGDGRTVELTVNRERLA
jgi:hypothetical protein